MTRSDFGRIFRRERPPDECAGKGKRLAPGYYVRVRVGDVEVTQKGGANLKEAREKLRELQAELRRQAGREPMEPSEMTFEDFAERFLDTAKAGYSPSNLKEVTRKVRNLLVPAFKGRVIKDIRKADVVRFMDGRPSDLAPATRNRDLSVLSAMFKKAVALGYATENPTQGIERGDEGMKPVPFVSPDGQEKLVAKCPDLIRPIVLLALETGLRKSELLSLRWESIQMERDVLVVRHSKNGQSREVPLTAKAKTCLMDLQAKRVTKDGKFDPTEKVINWLPKSWNTYHDRLLKKAVTASELSSLTFHSLRHIYASSLAQAGVPLPVIGTLLGHKSLRVTMRYARHAPEDATRRAIAQLQSWRNGKAPEQVQDGEPTAA
jgi:integrase